MPIRIWRPELEVPAGEFTLLACASSAPGWLFALAMWPVRPKPERIEDDQAGSDMLWLNVFTNEGVKLQLHGIESGGPMWIGATYTARYEVPPHLDLSGQPLHLTLTKDDGSAATLSDGTAWQMRAIPIG